MIDKRFTDIAPQTAPVEHGTEPTLNELIYLYYVGNGISSVKAARYTQEYIDEWVKQEPRSKKQTLRMRDESNNH